MSKAPPIFGDILAAQIRLRNHVVRTPLLESPRVNAMLGGRLLIKPEAIQRTGSFKFRGAFNFISQLDQDRRAKGVVAWSSGNHAQGVAVAAQILSTPATIVMPADAPALKIENTRAAGAEVVLYDRVNESREEIGRRLATEKGATVLPPYDHPWVIAGQGTCGAEIAEQVKEIGAVADAVIVPCSGGGFCTGVALALERQSPGTQVFAAEPRDFDDMRRSLESGKRETNKRLTGTICDALMAPTPGEITFELAQRLLAGSVVADDEEVLDAMALAAREYKIVLEPGGAVGLAAVLSGHLPIAGHTVVVIASGGNVDPAIFKRATARMN